MEPAPPASGPFFGEPRLRGAVIHLWVTLLALSSAGCAAAPPASSATGPLALALPVRTTDVEVRLTRLADDAPPSSDAEPRFTVEIRTRSRLSRVLDRPVLGAVSWNAGAAVLGLDRALTYERVDGFSREVARDVAAPPTSSADRSRLAYAVHVDGGLFDVVVHDGSAETRIAHGLASAGAFRFSEDARLVAFIAAENGGLAGAWVGRSGGAASARCVGGCDLRVGEALPGELPGPAGADDFVELRAGLLSWRDVAGTIHTSTWEGP